MKAFLKPLKNTSKDQSTFKEIIIVKRRGDREISQCIVIAPPYPAGRAV
jgi:hypothetical protein